MRLPVVRLAGLLLSAIASATAQGTAPYYTAESIVNAATNLPGPLSPHGLVSIYGLNLAHVTRAIGPADLRAGMLPTTLIGTGVSVAIDNIAVPILFVSPGQINFVIPSDLRTGRRKLRVLLNGRAGPEVPVELAAASPGLFCLEEGWAIATRPDGSLLTEATPAAPGDVIVVYATGLGPTIPEINGLAIPTAAAWLTALDRFTVELNGDALPATETLYAGITPFFTGLYQVNLRLPSGTGPHPEIRLRVGDFASPPGPRIPVAYSPPPVQ